MCLSVVLPVRVVPGSAPLGSPALHSGPLPFRMAPGRYWLPTATALVAVKCSEPLLFGAALEQRFHPVGDQLMHCQGGVAAFHSVTRQDCPVDPEEVLGVD